MGVRRGEAEGNGPPPQYAVILHDGAAQKVFSISTLEARGREELEARQNAAAEYPASNLLLPWLREGTLLQYPDDGQSFTEILMDPSGAQQLGGTYSVAELGAEPNELPFSPIAISPDKAYLLNPRTQRILVWDLAAMESRATLSLSIEVASGYSSLAWAWLPVVDDRLTILTRSVSTEGLALDTTVTVIDVKTDEVLSQQLESRCTALTFAYESTSGDRYFATSAGLALGHLIDPERYPAPCLLRIRAGEMAFDPTWQGSLNDAVGSQTWGALARQADGGLLVQVAPERAVQRRRGRSLVDDGAEIWQLWLVPPEGSGARQLPALPLTNTQSYMLRDAERRYLVTTDRATGEYTLTDVTDLDRPRPAITLPPSSNIWRIRALDHLFR